MPPIKSHSTETSEGKWDGPKHKERLKTGEPAGYYRKAFAWQGRGEDLDAKAAYRFAHHEVGADGKIGAASVIACRAGIGALNEFSGGTPIPESDRRGVYRHLARHMEDAGLEPPELKEIEMKLSTKDFRFDIKQVDDSGSFEGFLSVYDVVDLGKDSVEKGAFTKTIEENGGVVPLLWQHDYKQPIGTLELEDRDEGLWVKGQLLIDEVQQAREAYALVKAKVIKGLSIGYKTVRQKTVDGIRRLKEIKLHEGSVVTFPMLPVAQIVTVKAEELKEDFLTMLERVQVMSMRRQMLDALVWSLDSILFDFEMEDDEKITESDASIQQFHDNYVEFLPRLFSLFDEKQEPLTVTLTPEMRLAVEGAVSRLKALLDSDAAQDGREVDAQSTSLQSDAATSADPSDESTLDSQAIGEEDPLFEAIGRALAS